MKIWVYLNDSQQGPYSLEQLAEMSVTRSTPVWYDGLPQWMPAGEAPVTASLFGTDASTTVTRPADQPATDNVISTPAYSMHNSLNDHRAADAPPAPPTFIGWSVFLLLCCMPIGGLLGIIFSSISSNAYNSGNYQKAVRYSEWAEWTVILSIVLGLMLWPFGILTF